MLVTGGAGFIGCNFIRCLFAHCPAVSVINLDALTYAGSLNNVKDLELQDRYRFLHGDIGDAALVKQTLAEHDVRTIVNFAAESHVDRSITGPAAFIQTNIIGTFTLLDAARQAWAGKEDSCRFLHVSTDEVYGTLGPEDPAFAETTPYAPNSPYAASKAASDHLVRAYHHTYGLPTLTTNCSNNYGPYQYPEKLIPLMILNALTGKPLPVYGDGLQVRDWLYVEDHCAAIEAVLTRGRPGETYNVGGRTEKKNIEIVHLICEELDRLHPKSGGGSYREQITFVKDRPGHDRRYAINADKIQAELSWTPRESFETGIRKTIRWFLDHQDWVNSLMSEKYAEWITLNYAQR
ncbi:MAG: dTDP-glucose 4,6-dehydratase [Pirellulales bacterium]|nr:dTDP-glucose 4,6-dehydratase [Pirellulales bacterium]